MKPNNPLQSHQQMCVGPKMDISKILKIHSSLLLYLLAQAKSMF